MTNYEDTSAGYDPAPTNTLTAFYEDREMAERAIQLLVTMGIRQGSIRLVEGDDTLDPTATSDERRMGFWESIGDLLFPTEERQVYSEGLRRGGFLVTVTEVDSELADKALDILDDEGSIDIDERAASWRSEGWSPTAAEDLPPPHYDRTGDPKTSSVEGVASAAGGERADGLASLPDEQFPRVARRDEKNGRSRARSSSWKNS